MTNRRVVSRVLTACLFLFIGAQPFCSTVRAQPDEVLTVSGNAVDRILPDRLPDRYWLLEYERGLVLLSRTNGEWDTAEYAIGDLRDVAGPDSQGRLYCTYVGSPPGIHIFDCATASVVDTIPLNYYPRGLVLSADESKLYVCAWGWPPLTEPEFDPNRSYQHASADSGLVLEIDIASHSILRTATVGGMPETICLMPSSAGARLLVSTGEFKYRSQRDREPIDPDLVYGGFTPVDAVDVGTFVRLEHRVECTFPGFPCTNALIPWPGDDALVALCCARPFSGSPDYAPADYTHGIRLIDPVTNLVVGSLRIVNAGGREVGVNTIFQSRSDPTEIFVTVGMFRHETELEQEAVLAIDRDTGQFRRSIDLGSPDYLPSFVYETPCGDLIVTAWQAPNGKILIFEPENRYPECCLEVVTPMPYHGPAPALIEFDATGSYDPDPCDELTYEWDFDGDGLYGEAVDDSYTGDPDNPTHSYTASYHGPVMLRLSDNHGSAMTCTVYIDVDIM